MAMFGSDWLDDNENDYYDRSILHRSEDEYYKEDYDKPVCPPIHLDDYERKEIEDMYGSTIKHFQD